MLYPYGEAVGDMVNPKDDDGTSPSIIMTIPFTFYKKAHKTAYVCMTPIPPCPLVTRLTWKLGDLKIGEVSMQKQIEGWGQRIVSPVENYRRHGG